MTNHKIIPVFIIVLFMLLTASVSAIDMVQSKVIKARAA